MPTDVRATRHGRPQSVSSTAILAEARRLVSAVGVAEFSVRDLAKSLGIVPGTIHARFGNKDELLAALFSQRLDATVDLLDGLPPAATADVAAFLGAVAPSLATVRREYLLHVERDGVSPPHLAPATTDDLVAGFATMSGRLYARFVEAAAAEGVAVVGGSRARRLVWNLASNVESIGTSFAFGHADPSYRRFVATTLLTALAAPGRAR